MFLKIKIHLVKFFKNILIALVVVIVDCGVGLLLGGGIVALTSGDLPAKNLYEKLEMNILK